MKQGIVFGLVLCMIVVTGKSLASDASLVERMKSGNAVLMIRHALAPGIGDPEEFQLDDCKTQRNLNDQGREQARSIGDWLRRHGISPARIYSSQWCRCLETARLMQVGQVIPLPALNSFFQRQEDREPNLAALRKVIHAESQPGELIVMVTHQVTISGITGEWTDSGHAKLVGPGDNGQIDLLGSIGFSE